MITMSFIRSFTTPFALAVALWPFISLLFTLPVLALLYHRDNRLRFGSALMAYLVVLYLLALGCFTLYPLPSDPVTFCAAHHLAPQLDPLRFIGDIRTDGMFAVLQIALNVVFFVPLGFFMGRTFRWKLPLAQPVAFGVSLLIETAQLTGVFHIYPCAYRLFDVDDLIANTLGALVGYGCAVVVNRIFPWTAVEADAIDDHPGLIRRAVALSIDMVFVFSAVVSTTFMVWLVMGRPAGTPVNERYGAVIESVYFLIVEAVIPWLRRGRTLGGGFTRMTIETRVRGGWRRVFFYVVRVAVLYIVVCGSSLHLSVIPALLALALCMFWLIKREMPYDLI